MSTRAIVAVIDDSEKYFIYIHWDGRPEMVLPLIEKATSFAWKFPRYEAGDFAAAIIRVMKEWGWHIYLAESLLKHLDVNYLYEVSKVKWDLRIETHRF